MFKLIGEQLLARRMSLNLRREEIERHIHVRAHYLQALEEGNFEGLPSVVQTRGMLSNYAGFLDLNVDEMLLRFADVLQVRHRERHPLPPGATGKVQSIVPESVPPIRGFMVADMLGIIALLLLAVFSVWGINRVMKTRAELAIQPTSPSISDVLLSVTAPPTRIVEATSAMLDLGNVTATALDSGEALPTPTFPIGVTVQINLIAIERTYLRVTVDGKVVFDGRTIPGTAYPFDARERIEVLAGNGAALRVTYNQRDLGLLGQYGQVVNAIYTSNGVLNPTPTISPTPTITFTPSITPSVTPTMVPNRSTPTP
jgi:cytoskeletal protein RodZ